MHELLTVKAEQCPDFVDALLRNGDEILIEDTSDEYWARPCATLFILKSVVLFTGSRYVS